MDDYPRCICQMYTPYTPYSQVRRAPHRKCRLGAGALDRPPCGFLRSLPLNSSLILRSNNHHAPSASAGTSQSSLHQGRHLGEQRNDTRPQLDISNRPTGRRPLARHSFSPIVARCAQGVCLSIAYSRVLLCKEASLTGYAADLAPIRSRRPPHHPPLLEGTRQGPRCA